VSSFRAERQRFGSAQTAQGKLPRLKTHGDFMITSRRFTASAPCVLGGSLAMSGCSPGSAAESYEAVSKQTWRLGGPDGFEGAALNQELVGCATLAPSSHNTQCWKFALEDKAIAILPDLSRRCPAVDPGRIRSSAGIAVFVDQVADKAHWVDVGRCCERFALQATALGIRNAFLNQPVEVSALRPQFAAALGLSGQRPDLVVRFGRGPTLPRSLRRPVQAVLV
jgi:hypothetical protein